MTRHNLFPIAAGAVMGAMVLWMLHHQIMSNNGSTSQTLVAFLGAHFAVLALLLVATAVGFGRSSGWLGRFLKNLHRPSLRHMGMMLGGALPMAALLHFVLHGWGH